MTLILSIIMSGKHASVPQCKEGFEWDGRAVKELAGAYMFD